MASFFAVLNHGNVALLDVEAFCAATEELILSKIVPFWPDFAGTRIRPVPEGDKEFAHEIPISIAPNATIAGTLGYHTTTLLGLPVGTVELEACERYNWPWTVAGSHEIVEILGNPSVSQFVRAGGRTFPRELVDFTTSTQIDIVGVPVCSCVTPLFFDVAATTAQGAFDILDEVGAPLPTIPKGGWSQWQDANGISQSAYGAEVTPDMIAYLEERQGRSKRIAAMLSGG
jgi:hypothetical protein